MRALVQLLRALVERDQVHTVTVTVESHEPGIVGQPPVRILVDRQAVEEMSASDLGAAIGRHLASAARRSSGGGLEPFLHLTGDAK